MGNIQMKNSEIDCIGNIPSHWDVVRLKDIAKINKGSVFDDKLASVEGIYPYINGGIKPSDWSNCFNSNENTIAVSEGGASAGHTQFMKTKYWAGSHCYKLQSKNKNIDNKYIYYLLKGFEQYLMSEKTGSAMPNLQKTKFVNYVVSFINNIEEQESIVNYLDIETSKIDRKILILEQKFDKLEDYKQSVIFETVTKGLDSNVDMKDSGIDWIGDIPEHWEVKRVKNLLHLKGGGVDKKIIEEEKLVKLVNFVDVFKKIPLNKDQEYMIVSCPEHKIKEVSLKKNDILITPSSETPKEIGLANIVLEDLENTVFSYHILRLRNAIKSLNSKFVYYYFNSKLSAFQFEGKALGTTRVTLSRYDILSNFVFYPLLEEQNLIVDFLDNFSLTFDKKKEIIKKQIKLLQEYKQSIIFEAVTGKMEIV